MNEQLQKQIDELKKVIQSSTQNNKSLSSSGSSAASIYQNIPNPFSQTTTINYTLPPTYVTAKIIISNKSGEALKEVNVSGSGKGSVKIDASSLSNNLQKTELHRPSPPVERVRV